ncbi:MAG: hypothetical protein J6A92_05330 [Lachnospiraceae bacterium]|nr:hypothetical protein [Lachnospiraceae bacterium]
MYREKITWKKIGKFLRYENWVAPMYFLVCMPSVTSAYSRWFLLGLGISVCISYLLDGIAGNELPAMLYFCPMTKQERRIYFRKHFALRIGTLFLFYWVIMLVFFVMGKVDFSLAAEGMIYLCICGIPPMLRVGNGLQKEGLENFYGCDLCGNLLLVFGYMAVFFLQLEFYMEEYGDIVALVHTLYGKIIVIGMLGLMLFYLVRFYPKVEEYVLDYERVCYVRSQKENALKKKRGVRIG